MGGVVDWASWGLVAGISAFLVGVILWHIWPSKKQRGDFYPGRKWDDPTSTSEAARSALADALRELYAEGIGHRNLLIPNADFDFHGERQKLLEWLDRVVAHCSGKHVSEAKKSSFRRIYFLPRLYESNLVGQAKMKWAWTKKLALLQDIIDEVGG